MKTARQPSATTTGVGDGHRGLDLCPGIGLLSYDRGSETEAGNLTRTIVGPFASQDGWPQRLAVRPRAVGGACVRHLPNQRAIDQRFQLAVSGAEAVCVLTTAPQNSRDALRTHGRFW